MARSTRGWMFPRTFAAFTRFLSLRGRIASRPTKGVRLGLETMECRVVPAGQPGFLTSLTTEGGVTDGSPYGRTLVVGQTLEVDVAVEPGSGATTTASPTGSVAFSLSDGDTLGTVNLSPLSPGEATATLTTSDLPLTPGSYALSISYRAIARTVRPRSPARRPSPWRPHPAPSTSPPVPGPARPPRP